MAAILVASVASIVPVLRWERVGPVLVRHPSYLAGELVLAALILILTGVDSPFFFFTLGTALLGGLVYGYPGAALFSVMLIVVFAYAIHLRSPFDATLVDFRTLVVLPSLYPIVAVAGAGARRLLDRQAEAEADARRPGARDGRAGRARAARARHARLAGQDRARDRLRGAGALAPDRGRPAGSGRGRAQAGRRRAHGGAGGARAAERPARPRRRRAAAADRDPLRGGALGRAHRARASAARSTTSARCRRWRCASCAGSSRRRWPTSSATRTPSRVDVHLRRLGARVVLTIADDGVGFEVPDDLDQLAGGSFGLRGMRERAKLAGGDLSVESEPGDGTVISVWVPAGRAGAPARGPGAAARRRVLRYGAADGRRRGGIHLAVIRVLLVDDNAIVRRGIASLLADAQGIEVVGEAGDGKQAIEIAREVAPDVVCLDVRMPVMDGVAAAGPLSEKAKVLMLSYSEDEQLVTGRDPQRRRRLPRPRPLRARGPRGAHQGGRGGGDGALAGDHARGLRGPAARARAPRTRARSSGWAR